jgi:hypothetical protein
MMDKIMTDMMRALILGLVVPCLWTAPIAARAADVKDPVSQLFITLNESDPAKRDAQVGRIFTDNAVLGDSAVRADGHKAIVDRIEVLQRSLPGQKFQLIGKADRQHDAWRISFEVVDKTGSTAFEGLIFAVTTPDGRFSRVDIFTGPTAAPVP